MSPTYPAGARPRQISKTARHAPNLQWLFRTNIPRRRRSYLPNEIQKRNFFGLGEIIGVLTNPAETVRSLTESKRLLEEARREIAENRERSQIRAAHTFSRLPGFFPRRNEMQVIERALKGEPSFTVLFGASSVGKTALLREVLTQDRYHVLHFDLRIAGFADLESLYSSLSQQMEQYFVELSHQTGYDDFERESWSFKHDRLNVQKRIQENAATNATTGLGTVKTSDIARLMELFQSSLLKYSEFEPPEEGEEQEEPAPKQSTDSHSSEKTQVNNKPNRWKWKHHKQGSTSSQPAIQEEKPSGEEKRRIRKKVPVMFFDEAHKLPVLIRSTDAMKCLLDSMLVLTKQDRLCHVIHATSDPFYQTWLRQLNVMQHCKVITIGDCSKSETRQYFHERVLPRVPEPLRPGLHFESLYEAFGGKLAHWHDYITDYINSGGMLDIKQSSHFLQAHALLNLHLIHSSQMCEEENDDSEKSGQDNRKQSPPPAIHPGLGPAGFRIYSPISNPYGPNDESALETKSNDFSAMQLLKVMSRLTDPDGRFLSYFGLCRDIGVRAVDGMVKGRILDLRWTEPVTREGFEDRNSDPIEYVRRHHQGTTSSDTAIDHPPEELADQTFVAYIDPFVGPKIMPTTPIMRYAMREVVEEYEDAQSVSEYASLSDVDEY